MRRAISDAPELSPDPRLRRPRDFGWRSVRTAQRRDRPPASEPGQGGPLRVRAADGGHPQLPLRGQLLPGRDAVHPLRHRGGLPLPGGVDRPGRGQRLRAGRDRGVRLPADGCARLRLGAGGARLEIKRVSTRDARARDLLRGDLDAEALEKHVEQRVLTTTFDKALNWARGNSIMPLTFGLACCGIEMMSLPTARYDIARFGAEAFRASPRQADLLILSGRVSIKMAPVTRRIYDQMLEPKWVIAMGACSSSGGMFANYAVVQGADKFMPVDVHIPGCPPRPEAVLHGFNKLQRKIWGDPDLGWRQRYNAVGTEEWARGETGSPTPEALDAARRIAALEPYEEGVSP